MNARNTEKHIAVIGAYNPRNSGMYSVDLAAYTFLKRLNVKFKFYRAQDKLRPFSISRHKHDKYKSNDQLKEFSTILFWGDFINNPQYGLDDFTNREISWGNKSSRLDIFEKYLDLFFLDDFSVEDRQVLSVSNNFQTILSVEPRVDSHTMDKMKALYRDKFSHFYPRDSLSFKLLNEFSPDLSNQSTEAVDSAFLLDFESVYPEINTVKKGGKFSYYFARSNFNGIGHLIGDISKQCQLKPKHIDHWLGMSRFHPDHTFKSAVFNIKSSEFIITDVYHLAVNAMNLGIPVIGLGRKQEFQTDSCGDYKKKILFKDMGNESFYIESSTDDINDVKNAVSHLVDNINQFNFEVSNSKKQKFENQLKSRLI